MTTLILVMCFSAAVCTLLVILLIRSNQDQGTRDERLVGMMTTTMETLIQKSSDTSQTISSDLATVVEKVSGNMTEAVSKALADTNQTMTNLFLGREEQRAMSPEQQNEPNEKQPTPGIETFEGLPPRMIEALTREEQDIQRLTAPEWTVVSPSPSNGYGPTSEAARAAIQDAWTLDDQ
jgi:hypothetical protein